MVGIILKAIFFYFAFLFIRSMIRGYFNFKVLKEQVKSQSAGSFEGFSGASQNQGPKKAHDFSNNKGDVIDAEFKVLD